MFYDSYNGLNYTIMTEFTFSLLLVVLLAVLIIKSQISVGTALVRERARKQ